MDLIGINGLMGSGKDTTYAFIAEHHPGALRVAFADKLKQMAALAIGLKPDSDLETLIAAMNECKQSWIFTIDSSISSSYHVYPRESGVHDLDFVSDLYSFKFTGRQYLQWLGANARVVFGDTFWIDQVLPQQRHRIENHEEAQDLLKERYPDTDLVVVTDVRYPNEAERVRALGGEVWEVLRPGLTSDGHSSETPLPRNLVDREIHNDGDLDHLSRVVKEALNE